jgi:hypothetical protein
MVALHKPAPPPAPDAGGTRADAAISPALRAIEPPPRRVRVDALPEHTDYRDTGCDLSDSCLRCPLARCKYDAPGGSRRLAVGPRDRDIVILRTRYGVSARVIARHYGLSVRSIFRILRRDASGACAGEPAARNGARP